MATRPRLNGRILPRNDWEGDDFIPGTGGKFVTCQDTAVGRMVAFATNNRVNKDGKVYRTAITPKDLDGVRLSQLIEPVKKISGLPLVIPRRWKWENAMTHLKAGKGLVVDGWYSGLPRAYRHQAGADFAHAIWISHYSPTSGMRVWDPLNPDTTKYGRWIPAKYIRTFAEALSKRDEVDYLYVGYVPLQPLVV